MVAAVPDIHCLRDPTRGGLATTLNELALQSGVGMQLTERAYRSARRCQRPANCSVSIRCTRQRGQADLHLRPEDAQRLLTVMQADPRLGAEAAIIGG